MKTLKAIFFSLILLSSLSAGPATQALQKTVSAQAANLNVDAKRVCGLLRVIDEASFINDDGVPINKDLERAVDGFAKTGNHSLEAFAFHPEAEQKKNLFRVMSGLQRLLVDEFERNLFNVSFESDRLSTNLVNEVFDEFTQQVKPGFFQTADKVIFSKYTLATAVVGGFVVYHHWPTIVKSLTWQKKV